VCVCVCVCVCVLREGEVVQDSLVLRKLDLCETRAFCGDKSLL
jgi:hypothetical protein